MQEERLLRTWFASLEPSTLSLPSLFHPSMQVLQPPQPPPTTPNRFHPSMQTGWPLLVALDAIQPGSVSWDKAFKPPFKEQVGFRA